MVRPDSPPVAGCSGHRLGARRCRPKNDQAPTSRGSDDGGMAQPLQKTSVSDHHKYFFAPIALAW